MTLPNTNEISPAAAPVNAAVVVVEPPAQRNNKIIPGLFVLTLGGFFTVFGFRRGLKNQLKLAIEEMSDHRSPANQTLDQVLAENGGKARSLAVKAMVRGSVVAAVIAMCTGIALSYVVEANHKGRPKEEVEKEMAEIYRLIGLGMEKTKKQE